MKPILDYIDQRVKELTQIVSETQEPRQIKEISVRIDELNQMNKFIFSTLEGCQ